MGEVSSMSYCGHEAAAASSTTRPSVMWMTRSAVVATSSSSWRSPGVIAVVDSASPARLATDRSDRREGSAARAVPGVRVVAGATVGIAGLGLGLGTAACLVLGGIGLAASVVAFAAWARKQILRWGS